MTRAKSGKADAVKEVEGSSPEYEKASIQDTTGVEDQGMGSKGQIGNLREPTVSHPESQKREGTGRPRASATQGGFQPKRRAGNGTQRKEKRDRVSGSDSQKRSDLRRTEGSRSGA